MNAKTKSAHTRTSLACESASGSLTREPGSDLFHHTRAWVDSGSWHSTHGRVWLIGTRAQPDSRASASNVDGVSVVCVVYCSGTSREPRQASYYFGRLISLKCTSWFGRGDTNPSVLLWKTSLRETCLLPALGSAVAIRCKWVASACMAGLFELFLVCKEGRGDRGMEKAA